MCWSEDAPVAWERVKQASIEKYLVDEAHFIVSIRKCAACAQFFLQVTIERVDWQDGEDPIQRTVMPMSGAEGVELLRQCPPSETAIEAVGIDRCALRYDWLKGEKPIVRWSTGLRVLP